MDYNTENIELVAEMLIDGYWSPKDAFQHVFEDLVHRMEQNPDLFHENVELYYFDEDEDE